MDDNYRPRERRRSRSPDRRDRYDSRSRSPDHRSSRRDRSPANGHYRERDSRPPVRSYEERAEHRSEMVSSVNRNSRQENRVYVGNIPYEIKWHGLKDFMKEAGEVKFADILLLPNGMSKGCGIVEYEHEEDAQTAINTLSNRPLGGRLVYVREDRETEPRFQNSAPPARGGFDGGFGGRGSYGGGNYGGMGGGARGGAPSVQIFVSNLPFTVGWQDLKDLFRQAVQMGTLVRADVHVSHDGRPKGSGIVAFDNPDDAQNAIAQFNGYDWQGRVLEVREDRFQGPGMGGRGGYGGGFRGGFQGGRGGFQGGFNGGGYGGGRGGYGGGFAGARGGYGGARGGYNGGDGYGGGGFGAGGGGHAAPAAPNPFTDFATSGTEAGPTIYVRNLPWSTSNEDLVELFSTINKVDRAEIQYEPNGRSRGTGVVQFTNNDDSAEAISKFQGYQYGGRALGLSYVKYLNQGGESMEGQEATGDGQDQIM